MEMLHIHPYNLGSRSAMALKEYLTEQGIRAIVSQRLRSNRRRLIVGWGVKDFDFAPGGNIILNHPQNTKVLSCKKRFFNALPEEAKVFAPTFTSDGAVARNWG